MMELVTLWRESIACGLRGTHYDDRVLGSQSPNFVAQNKAGALADGGALNVIVGYVSALMEVKSSMGLIVAAPTAGACATLPGTLIGLADHMSLDDETVALGLLAGGLIGVFIADGSTFAADLTLSPRDREILLADGLLSFTRKMSS
jgi:L-serine dehydratase